MSRLACFSCSECGERLGWAEDVAAIPGPVYCDLCRRDREADRGRRPPRRHPTQEARRA